MPNPKLGTVTFDVAGGRPRSKAGKVEFRVDKAGIVHAGRRQALFRGDKLVENVKALIDAVMKAKPAAPRAPISRRSRSRSTMGPG